MITADTSKFTLQIDAWVKKAGGRTKEFAVEFIQDLNEAVVVATPVKTGFLRGSWHAALNASPYGAGVLDPAGATAVAQANLVTTNLQLGDVYYMTNGAAYARRVEYGFVGTDKLGRNYNQAPRAFVRGTLDKAATIAEGAAARVAAR